MIFPDRIRLLTQTIFVDKATNLMHVPEHGTSADEDDDGHGHRAFGVYAAAEQRITLDDGLGFERLRETFLHENLHAIMNAASIDSILDGEALGLGEHVVTSLAPVILSWLRENPLAIAWLQETQS